MNGASDGPEEKLRLALSRVVAEVDPTLAGRLESEPDSYLDLVALTYRSSEEIARLLQASVTSARLAGLSWERIGQRLGMSRQAVQQRFGRVLESADTDPSGEKRKLFPVTAFDEMEALAEAGRKGWHSVGYGMYFHNLVRTDQQWEHARVAAFGASRRILAAEGWQRIGAMWFPWAYYARPTGKSVQADAVTADPND